MAFDRRTFLGAASPARQLPIAGPVSNPSSLRPVYPIPPYEARGAAYLSSPNVRCSTCARSRVPPAPTG